MAVTNLLFWTLLCYSDLQGPLSTTRSKKGVALVLRSETPWHMAAKNGCNEAAKLLLSHGAFVEAKANIVTFDPTSKKKKKKKAVVLQCSGYSSIYNVNPIEDICDHLATEGEEGAELKCPWSGNDIDYGYEEVSMETSKVS